MRILIYGAGVIGCLYATLFSKAGFDTTIYARGRRLESFKQNGLLYFKNKKIKKAKVNIIDKVDVNDIYDFVFLTVKSNQVHTALEELKNNNSPNIVTMLNTLEKYNTWEEICGKGRIIPAFPGAGGSFEGNILNAKLTPSIIQTTTFGEINGGKSERLLQLASILKKSYIPYKIEKDMHAWQLCHLAMIVPIADAYYEAGVPEKAGEDRELMRKTAITIKKNLDSLHKLGVTLTPKKMKVLHRLPVQILSIGLRFTFQSEFGNTFMYQHSMKALDEMRELHNQFYSYIGSEEDRK
ncbi:ketopantoate reductase family protein [Gemella morbillorum]